MIILYKYVDYFNLLYNKFGSYSVVVKYNWLEFCVTRHRLLSGLGKMASIQLLIVHVSQVHFEAKHFYDLPQTKTC